MFSDRGEHTDDEMNALWVPNSKSDKSKSKDKL